MIDLNPFRGWRAAVRPELGLMRGRPIMWAACVAIVAVPSIYSVTYLSSIWDPTGHLDQLPVVLVNADRGTRYMGQDRKLGEQVLSNLLTQKTFAYRIAGNETEARATVDRGDAYFALVVPPDFSGRAMAADAAQPAILKLLTSPGTNITAATIGKRFAGEVADNVNEILGERRWDVVLGQMGQLKQGVAQLRDGAQRIDAGLETAASGSRRLSEGAHQLSAGVGRLTTGLGQADAAIRLMADKAPSDGQLDQLARGSAQVASGSTQLASGLQQLHQGQALLASKASELASGLDRLDQGSHQLAAGARQLTSGLKGVPLIGGRMAAGSGKLEAGAVQLQGGLDQAAQGSHQLSQGANTLRDRGADATAGAQRLADGAGAVNGGVQRLTGGMKQLGGGLRTLSSKLPADQDLARLAGGASALSGGTDTLEAGLARLADGSDRLSQGLETLYDRLPDGDRTGDPEGMARSVTFAEETLDPVPNNGTAFAPYFIALSLWLGAVLTTFVFHYIKSPESTRATRQAARMLAKSTIPGVIVLAQALVLGLTIRYGLHVATPHVPTFYGLLMLGSLTFLAVISMMIYVFGDAGKLLSLILLVFQLGAAGGPSPVELSNNLFRTAHPYLPITNLVKALRASLFDAYGGGWVPYGLGLVAALAGAVVVALGLGRWRWKYVPDEAYGPVLDV